MTIGQIVANRYRLLEVVGMGGMAIVYRARDLKDGGMVAVKVLREEYSGDEEFVRRFDREAQAAAAVRHKNLVRLVDVGSENGERYIVMEYVPGRTLKALIQERGSLPIPMAVNYAMQICRGLQHAHDANIIHRDIKPQNILVTDEGEVKIADFGIARAATAATITVTDGTVMGSVHYFSPEQARGEQVDAQSDIYSLGIVLYEMLTGHVPFDGETPVAVALKQLNAAPPSIREERPEISEALQSVVMNALAKSRVDRYATASQLERSLSQALRRSGKSNKSGKEIQRKGTGNGRKNLLTFAMVLLVIAALLGLFAFGDYIYRSVVNADLIPVPSVAGMDRQSAEAKLKDYGFSAEIHEVFSEREWGTVVVQTPESETLLEQGSKVQLLVSRGVESLSMPYVVGEQGSEIAEKLQEYGMYVELMEIKDTAERGRIVRQLPAEGEILRNGDTVTLYISVPSLVNAVPDVAGKTLEEALAEIEKAGLQKGNVTMVDMPEGKEGTIYRQSPEAGQSVVNGVTVDLWVVRTGADVARANVELSIPLDRDGGIVVIYLDDDSGRKQVYDAKYGRETNSRWVTINLSLEGESAGEKLLSVYVDDELEIEETVLFVSQESEEP